MENASFRLDNVVSVVQSSSPVLSEAEREWSKEVSAMQQKVGHLKRCVENVSIHRLFLFDFPSYQLICLLSDSLVYAASSTNVDSD